jgi:ferritin-like metal-binding protein YciE
MQTPNDLFLHEIEDMYDAEQRILQALPKLASEVQDPGLKTAFQEHVQQTQQHVKNLEQVFSILGKQPQRATCLGAQGIIAEHDQFLKESPAPQILTMFDVGAGEKTESYEITSYTGLVEKATLMGQQQIVQLLQQNLQQEQEMKQKLEQLGKQLAKQQIKQTAGAGA